MIKYNIYRNTIFIEIFIDLKCEVEYYKKEYLYQMIKWAKAYLLLDGHQSRI